MSNQTSVEALACTPVTDLSIGDARLRRRIKNAGVGSFLELSELSEADVDSMFDLDDALVIFELRKAFEKDPEAFARQALQGKRGTQKMEKSPLECQRDFPEIKPREEQVTRKGPRQSITYSATVLPFKPFSDKLKDYEERAKAFFDDLAEFCENPMVYQAFEEFSTELDDIQEAFGQLFDFFNFKPRQALQLIERHLPNIFIVYVADQARSCFDGANLWGNFFSKLGIDDTNVQSDFKQAFIDQLERRNMPLYAKNEKATYFFYTALLHGGLSGEAWEDLWRKALLPLAKEAAKGNYGFGGTLDGRAILQEIKSPDSRFTPRKTVLGVLDKAPDSTIAPLFEAAMRVAEQVEGTIQAGSHFKMLTNYGLPDIAIQALIACKDGSASRGKSYVRNKAGDVVYIALPMASLQLDLSLGKVCLRWSKKQFPMSFASCRIDYYVDGNRVLSKSFDASVGKCILDEAEAFVAPQARYDVELKLMESNEATGEWAELATLNQSFMRNKPGCFEFVRASNGIYRLRGSSERITRRSRIAYIVKGGLRVEPGPGMHAVSEHEAGGEWKSTQICLFDVDPGASGAVVDEATHEEVAVWQERYSAKIDKRRILGETATGLDLYGYSKSHLDTNAGLPSIRIETPDGMGALNDLEITCVCDGKRVSIPREVLWEDEDEGSKAAQIALTPSKSSLFDWHIELCEIEARQRSAGGRVVFRYRFSVIPIQEFRLASIEFEHGVPVATYRFKSCLGTLVTDCLGESKEVRGWCHYHAKALLKDEFLHLRIQSVESGKETDAKLALAAIDIELPQELMELSPLRPVCLADARELGLAAGNVRIRSIGWRYNRAALVMLGGIPLFYKELKCPGEHSFNLFSNATYFKQAPNCGPQSKLLIISVLYGDDISGGFRSPAWTDSELLSCREGLGFGSWRLRLKPDRTHVVSFDEPLLCDTRIEFKRKIGDRLVEAVDMVAGQREVAVPKSVMRLVDAHKKIVMVIVPLDWLGEPEYEYAASSPFGR